MQMQLIKTSNQKTVSELPVVKNFTKVIESRDINHMRKELYEFLNLYCGFIAHYNIDGFKSTYAAPIDFAEVFIRHFDRGHRYISGIYSCHEEPYKDTGFTKAEIKREFMRIVEIHKESISVWAEKKQRSQRYVQYLALKKEFEKEV